MVAAVVVEGSDSDEGGDLLSVELTELREFGEECGGGHLSDAGSGLNEVGFGFPIVIGVDEFVWHPSLQIRARAGRGRRAALAAVRAIETWPNGIWLGCGV